MVRAPLQFGGFVCESRVIRLALNRSGVVGLPVGLGVGGVLRCLVLRDHPPIMQLHCGEYRQQEQQDADADQQRLGELGRDAPADEEGDEVHVIAPSVMVPCQWRGDASTEGVRLSVSNVSPVLCHAGFGGCQFVCASSPFGSIGFANGTDSLAAWQWGQRKLTPKMIERSNLRELSVHHRGLRSVSRIS
jgi:hypothetical protein